MKRTKYKLDHYRLSTGEMGWFIPVGSYHVLAGDSILASIGALMRGAPMVRPCMHPVMVTYRCYYTPYRVLWPEFTDFITKADTPTIPQLTLDGVSNIVTGTQVLHGCRQLVS